MRIAAAAASRDSTEGLARHLSTEIQQQLGGAEPDLGILFGTSHYEDDLRGIADQVRSATRVRTLLATSAEGVIGPSQEYEQEPAICIWMASLPGVSIRPFHLSQAEIEETSTAADWRKLLAIADELTPQVLLMADPFSVDPMMLLEGINSHLGGCRVFGGMASGVQSPDQAVLLLDDKTFRSGAIGVTLAGSLIIDTVVSQGCRPVGKPFVITKAERNVIYQLGGRTPVEVLQEMFTNAPEAEQRLMNQGLFLGRVINERQEGFHRGDFLIRNLMGLDEQSGAIAVGDYVRVGITVQFHVRDAATASEDLEALLKPHAEHPPAGALLFSCNGRGTRMFPKRNHDIGMLQQRFGKLPAAGFFCAGELGPVGGKNFIHGHTASLALFRSSRAS
jgi:small ligand-binding sensory domain FIST